MTGWTVIPGAFMIGFATPRCLDDGLNVRPVLVVANGFSMVGCFCSSLILLTILGLPLCCYIFQENSTMQRILIATLFMFGVCGQQQTPTDKVPEKRKPNVVDTYDPDKLGPSEVACGRPSSKKSPPCECVRHRMAKVVEERKKCSLIDDFRKSLECASAIDACTVKIIDSESFWGGVMWGTKDKEMAPQCKRTCSKARCECCHT